MRKIICKFVLLSVWLSLWIAFSISVVFAQCGADGTQPCQTTSKNTKKKTNPKPIKSQSNRPVTKPVTVSKPPKPSVPTIIVNSDERMIGKSSKGDEIEILEFDKKPSSGRYRVKFRYKIVSASFCRIEFQGFYQGRSSGLSGGSPIYHDSGMDDTVVDGSGEQNYIDEVRVTMIKTDREQTYIGKSFFVLIIKFKQRLEK